MIRDKVGYKRERGYIFEKYGEATGKRIKTCYIAHMKSVLGLNRGASPNRLDASSLTNPCPPDLWDVVMEAVGQIHRVRAAR